MPEFTPFGDPFKRVEKALGALEADAAQLEKETKQVASSSEKIEKARKDFEQRAARGARVGSSQPISSTAATKGVREQEAAAKRLTAAEQQLAAQRQRSLQMVQRLRQIGPYPFARSIKNQAIAVDQYNQSLARTAALQGTLTRQQPPPRALLTERTGPRFVAGPGGMLPLDRFGPPPPLDRSPLALPAAGQTVGGTSYSTGGQQTVGDAVRRSARVADEGAAANERLAKSYNLLSGATGDASQRTRQNIAMQQTASRNMRSYGALTTEFFEDMKKGQVTLRDVGFQVSSTIGKFGGWLTAGAAVYTALGAVTAMGKGAIDASSGVSQLQRVVDNVDPSHLTSSFRGLSEEFNLPIEDVSGAAYQMGKVFHDQNKALEASRSILYAVKVGELDVATASRYLTSITQGFNLEADQQSVIFDQVNQAQNRFAITIQDSLAGLAKASGTYKAAGGDFSSLLALITTARRATGQTGEVIGTAIARSPNFLRKQENVQALREFGINASQPIDQVITQAFEVAQGLGGERLQQLAAAIGGPQYGARIFTPLLQQYDLYKKVLAETSPEEAQGSAQRELNVTLQQTSERLKAIVIQLGALGSNLADSGAFTILEVGLGALTEMLKFTNNLFEIFNKLPGPLKDMVSLLLQAGAAIKALRFFNFGQNFREGSVGNRLFTAPDQDARLYRGALDKQQDTLAREREAAAAAATRSSLRVQAANEKLVAATAREERLRTQFGDNDERTVAASQARANVQAQVAAAENAALEQQLRRDVILKEQLITAEKQALLQGKVTNAQARAIATRYGDVLPTRFGSPSLEEAARQRAAAAGVSSPGGFVVPTGGAVPPDPGQAVTGAVREQGRLARGLGRLSGYSNSLGLSGGLLAAGARGASQKMRLARTRLPTVGSAFSRLSSSFKSMSVGLSGLIGPLDGLLLGGFLAIELANQLADETEKYNEEIAGLQGTQARDPAALQQQIQGLATGYDADFIGQFTGVGDQLQEASARTADVLSKERNRVLQALNSGQFVSSASNTLFPSDIKEAVGTYNRRLEKGVISAGEFNNAIKNLIQTARKGPWSRAVGAELAAGIKTSVLDAKGAAARYQQFAALAGEQLQADIDAYAEVVQGGFGRGKDFKALISRVLPQVSEALGSNNPEDRAFAAQGLESLTGAIQGAAQQELETALTFAKGQGDRNKAYGDYIKALSPSRIRRAFQGQRKDLRDQLRKSQESLEAAQREAENLRPADFRRTEAVPKGLRDDIEARKKKAKQIREQLEGLDKAQREAIKRLNEIAREEARTARFEEQTAIFDARTDIGVSRLAEGLPQIEFQIRRVRAQITRAIGFYGRNSQEVLSLLAQEQDLINDRFQAQVDLIRAQGDYRAALADTPVEEARARLNAALAVLAKLQSNPRSSRTDILDAMTEVANARSDIAEEIANEAEEIRQAQFALARARAGDNDVKLARIAIREARFNIRTADTRADRIQGRADLIEGRKDLRESIAQREIEDIEFQADIGKLTLDQQIREYRRLLNTMNLTRDLRRDLRRRIHQLQQETEDQDFDLKVGDIKLPTIYEIRRAVQGGVAGSSNNVVINQNNRYEVNGAGDPEAVAAAVAGKQRDAARKNRNAMRSAGMV